MTKEAALTEVKEALSFSKRAALWFVAETRWFFRVIISSADRFYWDNGFSKSASLAYSTLFSIVPITALLMGLLTSFKVSQGHVPDVRDFIFKHFIPGTSIEGQNLSDIILQTLGDFSTLVLNNPQLSVPVVTFLVVTSILLLNSIEYTLNEIWQVFETRTISHRIGIFCAIIVITPVLAISAYYSSSRTETILVEWGVNRYDNFILGYGLPFVFDFLAFISLYYLVPKAPVKLNAAAIGAFLTTLLFGLAKSGFVLYTQKFSSYEKLYQSLAAIALFLFWLYLVWSIVLLGVEISYQAQYLPKIGKIWKRSVMSVGDATMLLAMQALVIIAEAFVEGRKLPNDIDLAEKLGCSTVILKPALDALERAGIIAHGDSRDMPITLQRAPNKIGLDDINRALFGTRTSMRFPKEMSRLFGYFVQNQNRPALTLADVVDDGNDKN